MSKGAIALVTSVLTTVDFDQEVAMITRNPMQHVYALLCATSNGRQTETYSPHGLTTTRWYRLDDRNP